MEALYHRVRVWATEADGTNLLLPPPSPRGYITRLNHPPAGRPLMPSSIDPARVVLDEALFCEEKPFDPDQLPIFLPPVPAVQRHAFPLVSSLPPVSATPCVEMSYALPALSEDASPAACGAVHDGSGSYEMLNLAPGLYEVRDPSPVIRREPVEEVTDLEAFVAPPVSLELVTSKASGRPPEEEAGIDPVPPAIEDPGTEGVTSSVAGPTVREGEESQDDEVASSPPVESAKEDSSNDASGSSPRDALRSEPDHDVPHRDLRVEANVPLTLDIGETAPIGTAQLRISGAESPLLDLMLLSPPVHGASLRDGFALTGGDAFTQEDIDAGRIAYRHDGEANEADDGFTFASPGGELLAERFVVLVRSRRRAPRLVGGGDLQGVQEGLAVAVLLNESADGSNGIAVVGATVPAAGSVPPTKGKPGSRSAKPTPSELCCSSRRIACAAPRDTLPTVVRLTYRAWDRSSGRAGERCDLSGPRAVGGATAFSAEAVTACLRLAGVPTPRPAAPEPWGEVFCPGEQGAGGAAIVRLSGEGTWQFSLDEDDDWRDCGSVYHGRATLLGPAGRLRFLPRRGASGKVGLSLRTWDGRQGKPVLASISPDTDGSAATRRMVRRHAPGRGCLARCRRNSAAQRANVERQRQQVAQLVSRTLAAVVGQHHLHVTGEFPQPLPASAARRCWRRRIGDNGDADGTADAFGDRLEDRGALGAHGQPIAGALAVARGDDAAVGREKGGANQEVRERR